MCLVWLAELQRWIHLYNTPVVSPILNRAPALRFIILEGSRSLMAPEDVRRSIKQNFLLGSMAMVDCKQGCHNRNCTQAKR